jgi:heme oxygenase
MIANEPATRFSEALRVASWDAHQAARHAPFMDALLAGVLPADAYAVFLVQLHSVYATLERCGRMLATDDIAQEFVDPRLERTELIAADLGHWSGQDWASQNAVSEATRVYCDRIVVAASWSGGFVAHHYVRYFADMSGGQIIRRVVERSYDVNAASGARMFDFAALGDIDEYKAEYRGRLDEAPWTEEEQTLVIEEIRRAYELNIVLAASLRAD